MKNFLPLMLCLSFLAGCQKEITQDPSQNVIPEDSCRIKTAYYYGGSGGINDTANFIYNAGRLVKVEGQDADVIYTYSGNNVITMHYYEKPVTVLFRIDSFHYVNDTVLSRIVVNDYDQYLNDDTSRAAIDFMYNGTKLSNMLTVYTYPGVPEADTFRSAFRWTGDNVSSILFTSNIWADDSAYYQYDNNPNYFRNVSPNFFMTDPFFQLYVGLDPHLPLFISRNNAINYTIYGGTVSYPIEYVVDSMSHPTLVRSGGFDYMGYKYECP